MPHSYDHDCWRCRVLRTRRRARLAARIRPYLRPEEPEDDDGWTGQSMRWRPPHDRQPDQRAHP